MKIVFLDVKTIGEDIDLSGFDALGDVVKYDFSTTEQALERTQDADAIVLNKVEINEHSIGNAKNLKLVCVTATGRFSPRVATSACARFRLPLQISTFAVPARPAHSVSYDHQLCTPAWLM